MTKPLRAYAVTEHGENTGGIVFARHAIAATRWGSSEYSDGDISSVSCRRAPWADHCAETGTVPAALMIGHGWHFECHGCGATIDEDWLREEGLDLDGVIGTQNSNIFCCARCRIDHLAEVERHRLFGNAFLDVLRAVVRERFGDVNIRGYDDDFKPHVYVIDQDRVMGIGQASLHFDFPGMQIAPASIHFDWPYSFSWDGVGPVKPHYRCCNGDREAFEKFAAERKSLAGTGTHHGEPPRTDVGRDPSPAVAAAVVGMEAAR